jgi:hypothetical protein
MLLWTAALFVITEPIIGHVIEPLLYGHSTGLSPVAVVASATFWTALWGPVGLVLATPLTVCLVVLGRHVERFKFLDVMLGDRSPLSPAELFYQRMLAEDPAEAVDKAEEFLKERPLSIYYDEVALPGLKLAQYDAFRGVLEFSDREKIKAAVTEVVDDLADQEDRRPVDEPTRDVESTATLEGANAAIADLPTLSQEQLSPKWRGAMAVLCVAGRGPLDEAVCTILAQLLEKHGLGTRVAGVDAISIPNLFRLEAANVGLVCLSYLDSSSPAHMRYTIRRLRRKFPEVQIVLGCWTAGDTKALLDATRADAIATTLRESVGLCLQAATGVELPSEAQPPRDPPARTGRQVSAFAGSQPQSKVVAKVGGDLSTKVNWRRFEPNCE